MKKVLIVGGGLQAVSTARSLKDCGYTVGIWCEKDNYALKSNAISFKKISADSNSILDFIKSSGADIAIPMSDKLAIFLSKNKNEIENNTHCRIAVPSYEVVSTVADKLTFMQFCKVHNFPHPITTDSSELNESILSTIPYPILIKPNHSVGARGITMVNNKEELLEQLPIIQDQYGKCHIQEYISGNKPYYNVMLYRDSNGHCLGHTILKIIRYYPLNGGSSSMCKTIEDVELKKICFDVLDKLNYVGFADFDVLSTETDEFRIIEINPRVPASLRGAAVSGVNFPQILCEDILNIPITPQTYTPGKTLRYLGLDIMWFFKSPKRFKVKPSWFRFFGKDIFYQEGGFDDWKVMVHALLENIGKVQIKNGKIIKRES